MRPPATAIIALAIASSSVAAINKDKDKNKGYGGFYSDSGPGGKAGKSGTKSSKSGDCTSCTAGTLTRAQMMTNLIFGLWSVDGVISMESAEQYCAATADEREAFLRAVENTAGCLVDAKCFVQRFVKKLYFGENVTATEGDFETKSINALCEAEQKGLILLDGGCDYTYTDLCDAINDHPVGDDYYGRDFGDDFYTNN